MAATYGAAERKATKIGSLGSVRDLIAGIVIGHGMASEAGSSHKAQPKNKKKRKPSGGGQSTELTKMLKENYGKKNRATSRSGPM